MNFDILYCLVKGNTAAANFFIENGLGDYKMLNEMKYPINPLDLAIIYLNIEQVKFIDKKLDLDEKDNLEKEGLDVDSESEENTYSDDDYDAQYKFKYPPLVYAICHPRKECVEYLIKRGDKVEFTFTSSSYNDYIRPFKAVYTPLGAAIDFGYSEIAKLLINNGANVNAEIRRDLKTYPVFALSIEKYMLDISKLLLKKGADAYHSVILFSHS
ncbi:hypothetical protein TVAG_168170 [Trichomonas vaginalis G3]|uniref:Uncharacterized protein n=1 Tax=Trichomonas vaginalis (strain ATCC PRA-98 / G3) TaxID=412133 RepID=A2FBI5_TRIV3|nr:Ankyrin repeat family [Trichomonas vaginalis G3]EAX97720.1 hypothetical protein TVAG_168170 [Trichomonas vaginalis G3]KAI5546013.1 Ankyrin repeat family [Trichomonas vaginalis G3]|eukprot:XP_001310650.1 hypothetical protein [Trichomonas vaginalis G3]